MLKYLQILRLIWSDKMVDKSNNNITQFTTQYTLSLIQSHLNNTACRFNHHTRFFHDTKSPILHINFNTNVTLIQYIVHTMTVTFVIYTVSHRKMEPTYFYL